MLDADPIILLIDNHDESLALLRPALEGLRAEISHARSAAEALATIASLEPSLVMVDAGLPDAFVLVETLRGQPRTRDVSIVLLDQQHAPDGIWAGLVEAGGVELMSASLDRRTLGGRVRCLLQTARQKHQMSGRIAQLERALAERQATEEALKESDDRYRRLFTGMTEGFAVHEIVCDGAGRPVDYRFIEVNPAFEVLTGLSRRDVVGRTMTEVLPGEDPEWVQIYGKVALTGEPVHFDRYATKLRRHYDVYAYRSAPNQFAVLFFDVTARMHGERLGVALTSVNEVIHSGLDTRGILQNALEHAVAATESDTGAISLRQGSHWIVSHVHGLPAQALGLRMDDAQEPHAVLALRTGRPLAINDTFSDARVNRQHMTEWGIRSVLVAPLALRDENLGVLFLNRHRTARAFDELDLDFTAKLTSQVSLALENARLVERLTSEVAQGAAREQRIATLARLYAVLNLVNEAVVRTRDQASMLNAVCRIIADEGQFPLVWIGLVHGRAVVPAAWHGPQVSYLENIAVEVDGLLGQGPTGTCIRERRPVINDDFLENPHTLAWRREALAHGLRSSVSFPLQCQDTIIGALTLYSTQPGVWDDEQVRLVASLAADLSYALDAFQQERLRSEAERNLRRSEEELRETDRRKNEFLATLSHELRNPLAPIRNSLFVLDRAAPGSEQARRAKEIISRQTQQLSRLVDDLLDVTRVSRNKVVLQRQYLELNELVRKTAEDHRPEFDQNGVDLLVITAERPLPVHGDAARLSQVISNLLQNAAKFTPPGGRTRVELSASDQRAVVRVSDTGVGVQPETLSRIFEPFVQADTSLDRSKGGLGLGLALVKGLIALHGGEVTAHSDGLNRGAEFVVRLPMEGSATTKAGPANTPPPAGRRRVLIIEDNVDAADSLCEALRLGEHVVQVAYNGPAGLARAREFQPEIVLCDIGLPGMDGFQVAQAFRRDSALANVVLVALSGYALPEDLKRAQEAGFEHHVAKPPSLDRLQALLHSLSPERAM